MSENLPAQFIPGATPTALELPEGCSIETWARLMANLKIVRHGHQWWIGDALNFANRQGKEYFDQALGYVMQIGYSKHTAVNCRSVAERIQPSRRREDAEFSLHACVAYIDDHALADLLLSDAINDEWDVTRLREEVRAATGKPAREPKAKTDWRDELLRYAEGIMELLQSDQVENKLPELAEEGEAWLKRYRDATQKP